ncbi:MAG: PqqD family protein [Geothrix sp.]|uniref:PqqD family protein n=1 Tax=Geothrix sp. TaxID=1962974 RepID=UPI0017907728|nr:PqqD family protein [Geothrix sp.]NWJ41686.1 PqqD family protein [Geothrix sp.]WIL20333.1 MAG: PqqD family protein [Geothrix sp.]
MNSFPDEAFLAVVPFQALSSEPGEDGTVVLIRPKILSKRWTWLLRMMKKPNYRVKLDARGTAVWQACDGVRTVAEVAQVVAEAFPGEPDAIHRTALFIRELARGQFINLFHRPDPLS